MNMFNWLLLAVPVIGTIGLYVALQIYARRHPPQKMQNQDDLTEFDLMGTAGAEVSAGLSTVAGIMQIPVLGEIRQASTVRYQTWPAGKLQR
jgi:hypothetical protein